MAPLGPLMRRQVAAGMLPASTLEEDVVIVRARKIAGKSGMDAAAPLAHAGAA